MKKTVRWLSIGLSVLILIGPRTGAQPPRVAALPSPRYTITLGGRAGA